MKEREMSDVPSYGVVIIGAGVSGLYQLYKSRSIGVSALVLESGTDVDCIAWKAIGSCHSSILLLVKHGNRTISRNGFESSNPPDEARNIVRISCSIIEFFRQVGRVGTVNAARGSRAASTLARSRGNPSFISNASLSNGALTTGSSAGEPCSQERERRSGTGRP